MFSGFTLPVTKLSGLSISVRTSLLALAGTAAVAGETTMNMDKMVVSGTRTPEPASQLGSSISVIGGKQLQRQQSMRAFDALNQVPGLTTSGSESIAPKINIRGASFESTLVMVDGVRVTMPAFRRSEAINNIMPDNIERIEVLRGPQSTLYGGDASAGVINIITKSGEGKPSGSVSAEYGSWNTRRANATVRGSGERLRYSLAAGAFASDWFSVGDPDGERDSREQFNFSSRIGYQLTEAWDLDTVLRWTDTDREDDRFLEDADRRTEETDFQTLAKLTHAPKQSGWENTLTAAYSGTDNRSFDDGEPRRSKRESRVTEFGYQGTYRFATDQTLTFGGEYDEQSVSGGIFEDADAGDIRNRAAYLQYLGHAGRLFYSLGGRLDHNNDFGDFATYRVTGNYLLPNDDTTVKANVGTGFRTPSVAELFGTQPCPNGNRNLQPEENRAWEAGLEHNWSRTVQTEVTYFQNRITDVITGSACEGRPELENKDRRDTEGVEAELTWQAGERLNLNANFTYTNARDKDDEGEQRAQGIPRRTANLGGTFQATDRLSLGTNVTHNSSRLDRDGELDSFVVVNATGEFRLSDQVDLFGRIENAFNEDYQTSARAQTPDRNMHIGIRGHF